MFGMSASTDGLRPVSDSSGLLVSLAYLWINSTVSTLLTSWKYSSSLFFWWPVRVLNLILK